MLAAEVEEKFHTGGTNRLVNMLEIKEDRVFTVGEESHSMEKEETRINPVLFVSSSRANAFVFKCNVC